MQFSRCDDGKQDLVVSLYRPGALNIIRTVIGLREVEPRAPQTKPFPNCRNRLPLPCQLQLSHPKTGPPKKHSIRKRLQIEAIDAFNACPDMSFEAEDPRTHKPVGSSFVDIDAAEPQNLSRSLDCPILVVYR